MKNGNRRRGVAKMLSLGGDDATHSKTCSDTNDVCHESLRLKSSRFIDWMNDFRNRALVTVVSHGSDWACIVKHYLGTFSLVEINT